MTVKSTVKGLAKRLREMKKRHAAEMQKLESRYEPLLKKGKGRGDDDDDDDDDDGDDDDDDDE